MNSFNSAKLTARPRSSDMINMREIIMKQNVPWKLVLKEIVYNYPYCCNLKVKKKQL